MQTHFQQTQVKGLDLPDSQQHLMRRFKAPSKSKGNHKTV